MKSFINQLEQVNINGDAQWINVRGNPEENTIVLFLHGGPGFSQIAFSHIFFKKLEEKCLVINWDQRASGKSFKRKTSNTDISLENYINDTIVLSRFLVEKFNKKGIVLVGHSWGCILGMHVIKKYPEVFTAFIGTGFGVNFQRGEKYSFDYLIKKAKNLKDKRAVRKLEGFTFPITEKTFEKHNQLKSKYISKYGGYFYINPLKLLIHVIPKLIFHPVYHLQDYLKMVNGLKLGRQIGCKILLNFDILNNLRNIIVPLYFFIGRHDYHTPFEMTQEYYDSVDVPYKEWVWFEKSAHSPIFEESNKFCEEIIRIIEEKKWEITSSEMVK